MQTLSTVQSNVEKNLRTVTRNVNALRNSKGVQEQVSRFKALIENRWFNLILFFVLIVVLIISVACYLVDLKLHYHLLLICSNALFTFLSISLTIIIAFCAYHLTRIILVFRERAKYNPDKGLFRWFTNPMNYQHEEDEDEQDDHDVDSDKEGNDDMDHVFTEDVFEPERSKTTRIILMVVKVLFLILAAIAFIALLLFTVIAVPRQQFTLPKLNGSILLDFKMKGNNSPTIVREKNGVVHITADVDNDVYFAQGVAHAQDRLFQLEYNKRVAAGTLSEIAGINSLEVDKLSRIIGFKRAAKAAYPLIAESTRERIQAYVDGINSYIASEPNLPPMFNYIGVKPTKWEPIDVLACLKVISWTLGSNHNREILRYKMLQRGVAKERIDHILPQYPDDKPSVLRAEDLDLDLTEEEINATEYRLRDDSGYFQPEILNTTQPEKKPYVPIEGRALKELEQAFDDLFIHPLASLGSNNWVISGKFTKRGKPLLSDDPHLKLTAPGIWHLSHLKTTLTGLDVIGASFVGVPGIIIGRNKDIAWGVTTSYADVQDIFAIEELEKGKTYLHKGKVLNYEKRSEYIRIVDADDRTIEVLETVYGPVINELYAVRGDTPLSLRWTALQDADTTVDSYMLLNRAKNYEEFVNAMRYYVVPSQNFVYADIEGNIGYILGGKVPLRKTGHSGRYVVKGNGDYDYFDENNIDEFIPFEKMPQVLNPKRGFIVSANNRIPPRGYPYSISQDYFKIYRAKRIEDLLEDLLHKKNGTVTWEDMSTIQFDVKSYMFEDFKPVFAMLKGKVSNYELWRGKLAQWDGYEVANRQEPAVFEAWFREIGTLGRNETGQVWPEPQFLRNALMNEDPACQKYFGVNCLQFAANALTNVLVRFQGKYGGVPNWAITVHVTHFSHQALDQSVWKCMASRNVYSVGGSSTVNVAEIANNDLISTTGVSYRQIIDLANVYHSNEEHEQTRSIKNEEGSGGETDKFIIPLGQSGNFFSAFYENLLALWTSGTYLDMKMEGYDHTYYLTLKSEQVSNDEDQNE